jgi:cytochrome d ubiquinol oxidase subunit II
VSLNAEGRFFAPLWTDLRTSGATGVLDWYTVSVGLLSLTALALHGAVWLNLKTEGTLQTRARILASRLLPVVGAGFVAVSAMTLWVSEHVQQRVIDHPWGIGFFLIPLVALFLSSRMMKQDRPLQAFISSAAVVAGMTGAAAFGIFPYLLPSNGDPALGLDIYSNATTQLGMRMALAWWIPAVILVSVYFFIMYRGTRGKVTLEDGH